jgi:hypothetical protein
VVECRGHRTFQADGDAGSSLNTRLSAISRRC